MNILTTTDYSIFKTLKGNRVLDTNHINDLVNSFKQGVMPFFIEVNSNFEIIDGQHRFEALKRLNIPINYCVNDKQYDLTDIIRLNNIKKSWSIVDYANYWKEQNIDNKWYYEYYINTKNELGIMDNILLSVFGNNSGNNPAEKSGVKQQFKHGKFNIENVNECYEILQNIKLIFNILDLKSDRSLAFAFIRIRKCKEFNLKTFFYKLEQYKFLYKPQRNTIQYIDLLEQIYNYKNQKKINLRY